MTVPNADPYLLPMAGLLTAVGLTEIYRLGPSDAFKQGLWIVIGVALFARRADRPAPRLPRARAVQVPLRDRRDRAALPAAPARASARRSTARGSGCTSGRFKFQPGELAKIFLIVFLAAYLREKREVLAQGAAEGRRPAARDLGRVHARARLDERPRLGAPLLRDLPRDALHRDGAALVRARRASRSSSPAATARTRRSRTSTSA